MVQQTLPMQWMLMSLTSQVVLVASLQQLADLQSLAGLQQLALQQLPPALLPLPAGLQSLLPLPGLPQSSALLPLPAGLLPLPLALLPLPLAPLPLPPALLPLPPALLPLPPALRALPGLSPALLQSSALLPLPAGLPPALLPLPPALLPLPPALLPLPLPPARLPLPLPPALLPLPPALLPLPGLPPALLLLPPALLALPGLHSLPSSQTLPLQRRPRHRRVSLSMDAVQERLRLSTPPLPTLRHPPRRLHRRHAALETAVAGWNAAPSRAATASSVTWLSPTSPTGLRLKVVRPQPATQAAPSRECHGVEWRLCLSRWPALGTTPAVWAATTAAGTSHAAPHPANPPGWRRQAVKTTLMETGTTRTVPGDGVAVTPLCRAPTWMFAPSVLQTEA